MIDFDETGLYKGFVKNQKGKKFPGRNPQLMSLLEVNNCDSFSGMMNPNVILMDADEEPHNEILQNIIKGENLGCFATDREGGRGVHVLMFNSNTSFKKADKVMLACGIVVDFHPGYSLPYECLKYQGTERKTIYNKQPFQEMPKYFTPLPKCNIDFANMGEGDGRNSTLYSELKNLQKKLQKLQNPDAFVESCAKELAARLLAMVKKRTPVGDYSGDSYTCETGQTHKGHKVPGKVGGTLRRGWTVGEIRKEGNVYKIDIINPVEYASYVEYGHRTANHQGWVKGHFMMTISEQELEKIAPKVLEKRITEYLRGCLK